MWCLSSSLNVHQNAFKVQRSRPPRAKTSVQSYTKYYTEDQSTCRTRHHQSERPRRRLRQDADHYVVGKCGCASTTKTIKDTLDDHAQQRRRPDKRLRDERTWLSEAVVLSNKLLIASNFSLYTPEPHRPGTTSLGTPDIV